MATSYSAQKAEEKKKIDQMVNKNIEQINKNYDAGIDDLSKKYDDQQRAVAVQKLINERKVAESMANLGVTDSGLNRTQQTAVQLSAANQAYNLNRQKQADINAYNLERDNRIAEIEQSRSAAHMSVDDKYLQIEENAKAAQAQAQAQALAEAAKPGVIMSNFASAFKKGIKYELWQNNVEVVYDKEDNVTTYHDKVTGNKMTVARTVNPYTGTDNRSHPAAKWGFFDATGYQPKGVDASREFVKNEKDYVAKKGTVSLKDRGVTRNVFAVDEGGDNYSYWYWREEENRYIQIWPCDKDGKITEYKDGQAYWAEEINNGNKKVYNS